MSPFDRISAALTQFVVDVNVRARQLFGRRGLRDRVREEMEFHVDMRASQLERDGVAAPDARRRARKELGNLAALRDTASDMWRFGTLERLSQDVRDGFRSLTRTPAFTAIAVLILAIGIGVNTAVFTFVNAYFLNDLPVLNPATLVRVCSNRYSATWLKSYLSYRDQNSTLDGLAAFQMVSTGVRIDREMEHTYGQLVSGNYFAVIGVGAERGRVLTADDDRPDAPTVVVLSHAFWQRRFAGSADVVGRSVSINDRHFTVVGVASPGFNGLMAPLRASFWVPLSADVQLRPAVEPAERERLSLHLIARLRAGVELEQANADLDTIGRQLRAGGGPPDNAPAITVYPATVLFPEFAGPAAVFSGMLMAVVGLVLLIVCVNVANLVLARAASREVELAIRQSIGAGRGRLVRQLLTESLMLAALGAGGGLTLAYWLIGLVKAVHLPMPEPIAFDLALDYRVLAFTTLAAAGAALIFGTAPALLASRVNLLGVLKGVTGPDRRHRRARTTFLVAQVSMSVLLLVTAALFVLALRAGHAIQPGFDPRQVLTASIDLEARGYSAARGRDFLQQLTERLEVRPGVAAANVVDIVPLTLSNNINFFVRETDPAPQQAPPRIFNNAVGPGHFRTLHIDLVDGRDFNAFDTSTSPRVVIVNETLARHFWPGERAIGKRLRRAQEPIGGPNVVEVVGVARDSKYVTVGEESTLFLYRPLSQAYTPRPGILVRAASGNAMTMLPVLTEAVRAMDAGLPVFDAAAMEDATSISLLPATIAGRLLAVLGSVALVLAALGIYGVLSFLVQTRARELAIRLAIGATPGVIGFLVVRQALVWTGIGTLIGLSAAFALTRLLSPLLFGIDPANPFVFACVGLIVAGVAALASFMPARRAGMQDPLKTLRDA